jgi:hypothetical protein
MGIGAGWGRSKTQSCYGGPHEDIYASSWVGLEGLERGLHEDLNRITKKRKRVIDCDNQS